MPHALKWTRPDATVLLHVWRTPRRMRFEGRHWWAADLTMPCRRPRPLARLRAREEQLFLKVMKLVGLQDHRVGNPRFDDAFQVEGGTRKAALEVLAPSVQQLLLDLKQLGRIELSLKASWVKVSFVDVQALDPLESFVRAGFPLLAEIGRIDRAALERAGHLVEAYGQV